MQCLTRLPSRAAAVAACGPRRSRLVVVAAQKQKERKALNAQGVISSDNSGKTNVFPTASKAYYSSPTTTAVASSGLGGAQGAGIVAAALALVVLATAGVAFTGSGGDAVDSSYSGDSLTAIAARLNK